MRLTKNRTRLAVASWSWYRKVGRLLHRARIFCGIFQIVFWSYALTLDQWFFDPGEKISQIFENPTIGLDPKDLQGKGIRIRGRKIRIKSGKSSRQPENARRLEHNEMKNKQAKRKINQKWCIWRRKRWKVERKSRSRKRRCITWSWRAHKFIEKWSSKRYWQKLGLSEKSHIYIIYLPTQPLSKYSVL